MNTVILNTFRSHTVLLPMVLSSTKLILIAWVYIKIRSDGVRRSMPTKGIHHSFDKCRECSHNIYKWNGRNIIEKLHLYVIHIAFLPGIHGSMSEWYLFNTLPNVVLFLFTPLLLVKRINLKAFNFQISFFALFQTWLILSALELSDKLCSLIRPDCSTFSGLAVQHKMYFKRVWLKGWMLQIKYCYINLNKKEVPGSTSWLRCRNQRILAIHSFFSRSSGHHDFFWAKH